MIGISGISGKLNPNIKYCERFITIHAVEGVHNKTLSFSDNSCAISLISRSEIIEENLSNHFFQDDTFVVFIEGYICPEVSKEASESSNWPLYILSGWNIRGRDFILNIKGEYNIAIYNKVTKELFLINDRLATRPFYYSLKNGSLFFASEKKAIFSIFSQHPGLSEYGVLEFLAFGHNLGQSTIFKDIKALPPASILSFKNGIENLGQYWHLRFENRIKQKEKDLVPLIADTLRKAAKEKYNGRRKLGMGLSGGLDSRVIAATIPEGFRPIFARTYGDKSSTEVKVAKRIAECLSFDHYIHEPKELLFSGFLYPSVWRTECGISFTGLKSILEHKNIKDKMLYNLNGHIGDVLTGKLLRPFMFYPIKKEKFIKKMFGFYPGRTYRNLQDFNQIFNPVFFNHHITSLIEKFNDSFHKLEVNHNFELFDIWNLIHRQTRFTFNSCAVDNYLFGKITLFTDYDFVDIMLGLPVKYRFGQLLYKKMIASQFLEIKEIPNANSGQRLKLTNFGNFKDLFLQYRLKQRTRKEIPTLKNADKSYLIRKDKKLRTMIISFTTSDYFPSNILSKNGILRTLEEHYGSEKNHSNLIGALATFIAAFELFAINSNSKIPSIAHPFQED